MKQKKRPLQESTKEQETIEGIAKLQKAFAIILEEEGENYLKELEELPAFQKKKYPSFQELGRDILFAINKNKIKFLSEEETQKEIAYYRSQLSEKQRKLTGEEKLREAYHILQKEEKENFEKELNQSLKRFEKRIQNPFYIFTNTWPKKIIIAIAGILLIMGISYFPKQEKILSNNGFLSREEETYTRLQLPKEVLENNKKDLIETYYRPTYLPEGYELEKEIRNCVRYDIVYKKKDSDCYITYRQNPMNCIPDINNMKGYSIEIINGKQIYYSIDEKLISLIYYDKLYKYSITSQNSNHTKNDLIKILDSLLKVD